MTRISSPSTKNNEFTILSSVIFFADFFIYRRWKATVSLLLSYPPVLLMKESSGRQFLPPAKGSSCHHPLLYAFKGTLGNGACVLCPKVIVMHGYSHAPQVTDIAGHIISRREVNELHPCVLAVCQYKIVFHDAFSFNGVGSVGGGVHRHALKILSYQR